MPPRRLPVNLFSVAIRPIPWKFPPSARIAKKTESAKAKNKDDRPADPWVFTTIRNMPITGAVKGAVFMDAGNLGEEVGSFGFGEMHYAGGLGLHVDLPFGPLRADYGWNLNRREGEPTGAFHFTVGIAF